MVDSLGDKRRAAVSAPEILRNQWLSKGFLTLGDLTVQVEKGGAPVASGDDPLRVTLRISSLPVGLRSKEAVEYLVHEFGRLVSWGIPPILRASDDSLKVVIDTPSLEVIPPHLWIEFMRKSGYPNGEVKARSGVPIDIVSVSPRGSAVKTSTNLVWTKGDYGLGKGISKPPLPPIRTFGKGVTSVGITGTASSSQDHGKDNLGFVGTVGSGSSSQYNTGKSNSSEWGEPVSSHKEVGIDAWASAPSVASGWPAWDEAIAHQNKGAKHVLPENVLGTGGSTVDPTPKDTLVLEHNHLSEEIIPSSGGSS